MVNRINQLPIGRLWQRVERRMRLTTPRRTMRHVNRVVNRGVSERVALHGVSKRLGLHGVYERVGLHGVSERVGLHGVSERVGLHGGRWEKWHGIELGQCVGVGVGATFDTKATTPLLQRTHNLPSNQHKVIQIEVWVR